MAASAHLLLSALSKHAGEASAGPAFPETLPQDPPPGVLGTVGVPGSRAEAPLTSEPPLPDAEPLTSEPPLADAAPLTSESDTADGPDAVPEPAGAPSFPSYPDLFRAEL